jgi:YidC/Oxa1 family membrane protein insertase
MLDWLYEAIAWLLAVFYSVTPNLGVAIILLTFTIMLLLYPLTAKQAKSMMAMQRVQPEMKKLQAKYKHDRQKLNEEMMKFYQENKINPLAGCLPLLAQMPIFISLFNVLRSSYKYVPTRGSFAGLYQDLCRGLGDDCGAKVTQAVARRHPDRDLEIGDTLINHLSFLGVDLQLTATDPHGGFLDAAPYFLLVALVMLTGFLQSRQAQKRTPVANKQMGLVMKVLPVFFGLISLNFPAGLVLYFFVSNLWRLGQQEVIFRRHGSVLHGPGGKTVDAQSTVRAAKPARGGVREELGTAEELVPEQTETPRAAPAPGRTATPAGRGTGLRGLFALPPPPDANGGTRASTPEESPPAGPGPGGGRGSGSSGARRRNKKKRRR